MPASSGRGPGAIAPDGCAVEVYRRLPHLGEADLVHAAVPPGTAVLDLGAGVGRVAHPLAVLGHRVVAVDESAAMLAEVRPPVEPVLSRVEDLALRERFGGVLLASHLLDGPDPGVRARLLAVAARHLADGGVLVAQRYAPSWWKGLAPGGRYAGRQGDVDTELHVARLDASGLAATVVYEVGGQVWEQSFTAARLSGALLDAALAAVGLRRTAWLDPDRAWFAAAR